MRLAGVVEHGRSELSLLPTFNLTVRRNHLIEDVLSHLNQFENEDLRRELMVKYNSQYFCCREKEDLKRCNHGSSREEITLFLFLFNKLLYKGAPKGLP